MLATGSIEGSMQTAMCSVSHTFAQPHHQQQVVELDVSVAHALGMQVVNSQHQLLKQPPAPNTASGTEAPQYCSMLPGQLLH